MDTKSGKSPNYTPNAKDDPGGMLGHIMGLPDQIEAAWALIQKQPGLPADYRDFSNIVLVGMGGSAIGGDLVRTVVSNELSVPLLVVRDYTLPAFVTAKSLVVLSSHSGNTEETLTALGEAKSRGAKLVAITTGGKLLEEAKADGFPFIQFAYPSQPRAAVGYSTILLLGLLEKLGLISPKSDDVHETVVLLRQLIDELGFEARVVENPAYHLSGMTTAVVPVIWGGFLAEVARRWKGQLNENSKSWAFYDTLPELNHNSVVGFEDTCGVNDKLFVITLASKYDHPRVQTRIAVTTELMEKYGVNHYQIDAQGESRLAQVFSALYVGDWFSLYCVWGTGIDPTPIEPINFLKESLARSD